MTILLYANNAASVLGAPTPASGAGSTTFTLSTGAGALYPSPSTGQGFYGTLRQASNLSVTEIVLVTARSGDALTVVRAQDGTTARNWLANDKFDMFPTAATMRNQVQADQYQNGTYVTATAGGSANALTATVPSGLTALTDGFAVRIIAAAANTNAATLNLTLGSTATGAFPIVKGDNIPLAPGDIPAAGYPILLNASSTFGAWVMQNPATEISKFDGTPTKGSITLGGLIINWGIVSGSPLVPANTSTDVSTGAIDTAFPNGLLFANAVSADNSGSNPTKMLWNVKSNTLSSVTFRATPSDSGAMSDVLSMTYLAIGY